MSNSSNFEDSTMSLISEMETGFSERKCTKSKQLPWMEKEGDYVATTTKVGRV